MRNLLICSFGLAVALVSACGGDEETTVAGSALLQDPCATVLCPNGTVPVQKGNTCKCQTPCTTTAMCVQGWHWDDARCACVRDKNGVACGSKTCPAGQVCCNASCGICTLPGGYCTQQICSPVPL